MLESEITITIERTSGKGPSNFVREFNKWLRSQRGYDVKHAVDSRYVHKFIITWKNGEPTLLNYKI